MSDVKNFIPWVSFIAGLGGSLHCVGMCGGLVTATCEKNNDVFRYQIGRLLGYLLLGLLGGLLGSLLNFKFLPFYFTLIPAVIIGGLFIFWGIKNYQGKKAELPIPKFLGKVYSSLWYQFVHQNFGITKSFITGLISILLPCGLLYGIVISTFAMDNQIHAMTSMFFFWLGTVPSMVMAPSLVHKFLRPLKKSLPKAFGISLVLIGIITISFRMIKVYHSHHQVITDSTTEAAPSCH
jgi:hypothetical protein